MAPVFISVAVWVSILLVGADSLLSQDYVYVDSFDGLSASWKDQSFVSCTNSGDIIARCSASCFSASTCRGVHYLGSSGGRCDLLYDTSDIPESSRTNYNYTSVTANILDKVLLKVFHKCLTTELCHNGGSCINYRCNCTNTNHWGPRCETGGDPWTAPPNWNTLHPSLHLNLDDAAPYTIHGGATHISTENGMGFQTGGYPQYVDLGDLSNETCFADCDSCVEGFTMFTYIKIVTASSGNYLGYISSTVRDPDWTGIGLYGYLSKLGFQMNVKGKRYVATIPDADNPTYPTGWLRITLKYTVDTGVELYVDNILKASAYTPIPVSTGTNIPGHITFGRYFVDYAESHHYGRASVDYLTFWNRPLSVEERNLLHQG